MNQVNSIWDTPGITDRLIELSSQKMSTNEIAKQLSEEFQIHVKRNAVIGKFNRLKIKNSGKPVKLAKKRVRTIKLKPALAATAAIATTVLVEPIIKDPKLNGNGILIDQLRRGVCHYPVDADGRPPYHYCGASSHNGTMYCVTHDELMHKPAKKDWK
jgi:hypothetical protein